MRRTLRGGDDLVLVGIALGAYGLTQAILQIPFGMAADRYGRKRVILVGLVVFAAGSFVAAGRDRHLADDPGRVLQGAGAISAAVMALAADLTREEHRTKTMAMIGAIDRARVRALAGRRRPSSTAPIGMGGIFVLTGVLALAGDRGPLQGGAARAAWPTSTTRPTSGARRSRPCSATPSSCGSISGILALHMVQMAMFVVVPPLLVERAGLPVAAHWQVYLPVVLASFVLMIPPLLAAERHGRSRRSSSGSIALLAAVQVGLTWWATGLVTIAVWLLGFFVAFNVLEAAIPSLVTRVAPPRAKATALGVYNTTQAFGLFAGGALGGWLAKHFGADGVFMAAAALAVVWLAVAAGMRIPPPRASRAVAETGQVRRHR